MDNTKGKPVLRDLFCCEGGASVGFHRAGFDVEGVDLFKYRNDKGKLVGHSQSRYPFRSHKGDWRDGLQDLDGVAVLAASPPCWRYSAGTRMLDRSGYPDLLSEVRAAFIETGLPYVIENVGGTRDAISEASLIEPLELCGCMFDMTAVDDDGITLHLERIRLFESNVPLVAPGPHDHSDHDWVGGVYGGAQRDKYRAKYVRKGGYVPPNKRVAEELLGIDWMTWDGLYQAIPPVYTEWIGAQLMTHLANETLKTLRFAGTGIPGSLNPS